MKSAITPGIASAIERPIHRGVCRPFGGRRKTLSRRFADILKGRTAIVYDPQDLTTMYQDASGTLPVYRPGSGAVDPPVGLLLDKSMGLELGPELWTGVLTPVNGTGGSAGAYNQATGELSNAASGTVSSLPTFRGPALTNYTFYRVRLKFSGNLDPLHSFVLSYSALTGIFKDGGVTGADIRAGGGEIEYIGRADGTTGVLAKINTNGTTTWNGLFIDSISIREIKGYHAHQTTTTARPTLSGRYNLLLATETLSTQSVTTVATDYTFRFEDTGTVTLSGAATGVLSAGTHTVTCTAGTLTCTVAGSVTRADLRVKRDSSSLPAYQRVDSATTYDTNGFPLYIKRDRVDDDLIVRAPAITGSWAHGTIDVPVLGTVAIPAGEYHPFGSNPTYGLPDCTQWIAIDGNLSASEQAVFERYVYSKARNIANSGNSTSLYRAFASRNELQSIRLRSKSYSSLQQCFYLSKIKNIEILSVEQSSGSAQGAFQNTGSLLSIVIIGPVFSGYSSVANAFEGSKIAALDISSQRFSSLTSAASFCRFCPSLTTINVGAAFDDTPCTNFTNAFGDTNLNQASIDAILVSINTAGTSNGTFNQSGGSAPSATGQAAITSMRSRGWTVTVTGGF